FIKTGVNESGAEFGAGKYPGTYNKDYIYPDVKAIQTTMNQGMNIFRVGFSWERMQRRLNADFDATEFKRLDNVISYITKQGAVAILNPHNFARYNNGIVGSRQVPNSAFSDFWKRMAQKYKNNGKVWFGLVNEPHDMPTKQWFAAARDAVNAIRAVGASNTILVPGNAYTGAWCWNDKSYGGANAEVALQYFSSRDKGVIFEVHQYFDSDYSGTHEQCVQRPCNKLFVNFVEWLKRNQLKGFVGELGAAVNRNCKACVEEAISYLEQNSNYVVGWAWWAAGPWWGNYMYSLEPKGNTFPEQMSWLKPHLVGSSTSTSTSTSTTSTTTTTTSTTTKPSSYTTLTSTKN
ncbi:glycoside hydrolase family 5 protein, partial [Piromyces sp. E2]